MLLPRRLLRPLLINMPSAQKPRVHVHVSYPNFDKYEPVLRKMRWSIELYIGSTSIDTITPDDARRLKDSLEWEHTLSIHGPFMDLSPGAIDKKVAAASLERYLQVISLSKILKPEVVVFHSGYEKWKYAGNVDLWLNQSIKTWRAVMDEAEKIGVKVAIENIVDEEPGHLKYLAEKMDHPLFGLCLDVGHRELFSKLSTAQWAEGMHPYIFELHLHDNLGEKDDHMPIGDGQVDFTGLFGKLKELGANPVYTLEAHSAQEAVKSMEALSGYGIF